MRRLLSPILLFILCVSLLANALFLIHEYREDIVARVVDGDSFDLADGRRIRLFSLDAPEKDRCGADEARTLLASLILGKHVRMTDFITDEYGRQLANVFVGTTLVNEIMVREGRTRFTSVTSSQYTTVKRAAQEARQAQRGIWGPPCRTTIAPPNCEIKANTRHGDTFYHLPGCKQYTQVIIDESFGDHWFCTEAEAQSAGFTKATSCP